jgi:hypothetical protein
MNDGIFGGLVTFILLIGVAIGLALVGLGWLVYWLWSHLTWVA